MIRMRAVSVARRSAFSSEPRQTVLPGFTIIELLIVVVVIAILAAITIVSYNGITRRATETAIKSDLHTAATQLGADQAENGSYPVSDGNNNPPNNLKASTGNTFQYTSDGTSYCLTAISDNTTIPAYHVTSDGLISEGSCPGHGGGVSSSPIQTISNANCPSVRTRTVDARDNHTYWVQKLGDGKCWMLTNLAYAGGGVATYGDTKTLVNGSADTATTYAEAKYYIVPGTTNYTTEPVNPSTSTDGTGQYGYMYNWCAAMGVQTATSACMNASTPAANTTISICPAGWRLPATSGSNEFTALNTAVNGGSTTNSSGLLNTWLAQRSGAWTYSGFAYQGATGLYWASTQYSSTHAYYFGFSNSNVNSTSNYDSKSYGRAIRCVAN